MDEIERLLDEALNACAWETCHHRDCDGAPTRPGCIYALRCPDTSEIRYIGVTHQKGRRRLNGHLVEARGGQIGHKDNWVRSLLGKGKEPVWDVLLEWPAGAAPERNWVTFEQLLIAAGRAAGLPLTNVSDGGQGALGVIQSAETLAKRSAAHRGKRHSPETIAKLGDLNRGRKHSAEARANMAAAQRGKKQSAETIAKRVATLAARGPKRPPALTPEARAKMSAATLGKKQSAETIAKRLATLAAKKAAREALEGVTDQVDSKRLT